MGDVLWIEPIIRQLASQYKKVVVHTRNNVLFENYPLPNVVFKSRQSIFEKLLSRLALWTKVPRYINLDMAYERNPKVHFLHAYQMKSSLPQTIEYPKLHLTKQEEQQCLVDSKYVVLHLDSESDKNFRRVFGVDWNKIVRYLSEKGYKVVQVGAASSNIENVEYLKTDLRQMMSLIVQSSMFIGIDSGPSHVAASLNVPSLIFFGAVNPLFRHFPELFNGYFLQQPCEFSGCFHTQTDTSTLECRLVGDKGIPKCSLHSDAYVIQHIDLLINKEKND